MMLTNSHQHRARIRRKWRVVRDFGPLVLASEYVLKRMIAHAYPCQTIWQGLGTGQESVVFEPSRGFSDFLPGWEDQFYACVRTVSEDYNVKLWSEWQRAGAVLFLDGEYHVNSRGEIAKGSHGSDNSPGSSRFDCNSALLGCSD